MLINKSKIIFFVRGNQEITILYSSQRFFRARVTNVSIFKNKFIFVSRRPSFVINFKNKTIDFRLNTSPVISIENNRAFLTQERVVLLNQINFNFLIPSYLDLKKTKSLKFQYSRQGNVFEQDYHYVYFNLVNIDNAEQFYVWLIQQLRNKRKAKIWGIRDDRIWLEVLLKIKSNGESDNN